MVSSYEVGLEIDRIDVDGDYCRENCRWVTHLENSNNRSNNVVIQHNGILKTLSEWSIIFDIDYHTLYKRLNRGYTFEEAISKLKRETKQPTSLQHLTSVMLTPLVETHSISEIANMFNVNRTSLKARVDALGIKYVPKKTRASKEKLKCNCAYYPCHTTIESCEYCYCPLYFEDACIGIQNGDGVILSNGVKDCSNCEWNHLLKNIDEHKKTLSVTNSERN